MNFFWWGAYKTWVVIIESSNMRIERTFDYAPTTVPMTARQRIGRLFLRLGSLFFIAWFADMFAMFFVAQQNRELYDGMYDLLFWFNGIATICVFVAIVCGNFWCALFLLLSVLIGFITPSFGLA